MQRARRWAGYVPAIVYAAGVLWVGTRPQLPGPPLTGHFDKVAHFTAYAVLGALLAWGWLRAGRWPAPWPLLAAAVALGTAEELLQSRIVGREGDPLDWLADAAGAITGFTTMARALSGRVGKRTE